MFACTLGSLAGVSFYYAIFEGLWGAAAGKALCRLRVVGPDKNPPGFLRAWLRALIYVVLPALPSWLFWIAYGGDPRAVLQSSTVVQQLLGLSFYLVLALLFCTARRRNGFAAVHDLATKTRVISRTAIELRPVLAAAETPPLTIEAQPTAGPYHVLETLETNAGGQWLLGYDLRLLRKVWIRTVPPGTPPIPTRLGSIGRVGRLRWLAGRRTPEENWDAFEGVSGEPLLRLIRVRQPWRQVRFWLYDLAREIGAAEKDGTLPAVLTLDRVWITRDGRAKLLDFPVPGLAAAGAGQADAAPGSRPAPEMARTQRFLGEVAVAALEGRAEAAAKTAGEAAVPLPLHARVFLHNLPQLSGADAVAGAIQPLLRRPTAVSRLRRAAVVAGCAAFPALMSSFLILGMTILQQSYPAMMELSLLLQLRQANPRILEKESGKDKPGHKQGTVTDRQFAVFIATHYRASITNDAIWNSPMALSLIKGDGRRFAEQSVAEHPAPTKDEIANADAALSPLLHNFETFRPHPLSLATVMLAIYVGLPAWIAALLFRGGLVLRVAGIVFVRRDGMRASRLRVFWRALVAWGPLWLGLIGFPFVLDNPNPAALDGLPIALSGGLFCGLAILSVALPERGVPDRCAGTWPVPR
jgi:hypothetical protein